MKLTRRSFGQVVAGVLVGLGWKKTRPADGAPQLLCGTNYACLDLGPSNSVTVSHADCEYMHPDGQWNCMTRSGNGPTGSNNTKESNRFGGYT